MKNLLATILFILLTSNYLSAMTIIIIIISITYIPGILISISNYKKKKKDWYFGLIPPINTFAFILFISDLFVYNILLIGKYYMSKKMKHLNIKEIDPHNEEDWEIPDNIIYRKFNNYNFSFDFFKNKKI